MKSITQLKAESTLNKLVRYQEGVMSRKDWLKMQLAKGATVEQSVKPQVQFNRIKYNRMSKGQDEYMKKCNTMVTCFYLNEKVEGNVKTGYEITKTEYDYFNNVLLAQDIMTEKMDVAERIEAGIATEEQINNYMQEDFNFINKYYGKAQS